MKIRSINGNFFGKAIKEVAKNASRFTFFPSYLYFPARETRVFIKLYSPFQGL